MEVTVIRPMTEDRRDYRPGDKLSTSAPRADYLAGLGLVKAPPPWDEGRKIEWEKVRLFIGAGPIHPVFRTKRQRLEDLRPGEKFLLVRKVGGLGDILVQSQIFPELADQYPGVIVDYAIPRHYWPLFEGTGIVTTRNWSDVYGAIGQNYPPESTFWGTGIRPELLDEYSLIEDISRPCLEYESLLMRYFTIDGAYGFLWRDRLDVWANVFGLKIQNARTCIQLRPEEIREAKDRYRGLGAKKPILIWAPMSGDDKRNYPWHAEVTGLLSPRWDVFYLHDQPMGPRCLPKLSLRQMGAAVAAADAVVAVDTSTYHWGGLLRKPTVGIFNLIKAEARSKYYPTARFLQICESPCIGTKYQPGVVCPHWPAGTENLSKGPNGRFLSRCYPRSSVEQIVEAVDKLPITRTEPALTLRPDTDDFDNYWAVVECNEYRLPERLPPESICVDVGAHIGCFSHAVLTRGAAKIYAFEAEEGNFGRLTLNLASACAEGRAVVARRAVWRSDGKQAKVLHYTRSRNPKLTGSGNVLWGETGQEVEPIPLDDILLTATSGGHRVALLKLDCEGSEWPILFTSKRLDLVDEIVGEYHEIGGPNMRLLHHDLPHQGKIPARAQVGSYQRYTKDELASFLRAGGFSQIEIVPSTPLSWIGHFFARRAP